jgi:hypothetical protein
MVLYLRSPMGRVRNSRRLPTPRANQPTPSIARRCVRSDASPATFAAFRGATAIGERDQGDSRILTGRMKNLQPSSERPDHTRRWKVTRSGAASCRGGTPGGPCGGPCLYLPAPTIDPIGQRPPYCLAFDRFTLAWPGAPRPIIGHRDTLAGARWSPVS